MTLDSRMQTFREIMEALKDPNIHRIGVYGMPGVGKTTLVSQVAQKATKERLFDEVVTTIQQEYAAKKVLLILDDKLEARQIGTLNITAYDLKVIVTSRSQVVLSKIGTQKDFLVEPLNAEEALHLFRKEAITSKLILDDAYDDLAIQIAKECAGLPLALVEVAKALRNRSVDDWKRELQKLKEGSSSQLQTSVFPKIRESYYHLESDEIRSIFLLSSILGTRISYEELLKYAVGLNLVEENDMEHARRKVYGMMDSLKRSCLLQDGNTTESAIMHDVIYDLAINLAYQNHMFVVKHDVELTKWPDKEMMLKFTHVSFHGSLMIDRLDCAELRLLHVFSYNDKQFAIFEWIRGLKVLGLKDVISSRLLSSLHLLTNIQTLCLDQCKLSGELAMIGALKSLKILRLSGSDIEQLPKEIGQLTGLCSLDLSNCPELCVIPSSVLSQLTRLQELNLENSCSIKWGEEIEVKNGKTRNASPAELNPLGYLTSLGIHIPNTTTLPDVKLFDKLIRYKISIGDGGWQWQWSKKANLSASRIFQLKLNNAGVSPFEDGIKVLLEKAEGLWLAEVKGIKNLVYELDKNGFQELKHLHVEDNSEIECIVSSLQPFLFVAFPILESLVLNKLIKLREVCSIQLSSSSFGNLRVVRVERCDFLQFFLPASAARGLVQLKEIELSACRDMGAIVAGDKVDTAKSDRLANDAHVIQFPQLRALTLQFLPQFRALFSYLKPDPFNSYRMLEDRVGFTLVEQGKVKVELPRLEYLKLDIVPKMGHICQIFRFDYGPLHRLQRLLLLMKQLRQQKRTELSKLKRLVVSNCEGIDNLFSAFPSTEYPMLMEKLEISNCENLTQVIQGDEEAAYTVPVGIMAPLSCLNSLKLTKLAKLVTICSAIPFLEFPSLKELTIDSCPQMKSFAFACMDRKDILKRNCEAGLSKIEGQVFIAQDLEKLNLLGLNQIAQICDSLKPGEFRNLKKLELRECSRLKYLFPESVARGLALLLEIRIYSCNSMEQIVGVTSGEPTNQIVFPEVRTLDFKNLPELVSFCSGNCFVIWSSLKKITVENCPKIKKFGLGRLLTEMKDGDFDSNIENLFELWDSYANIEEFKVDDSEQLSELFVMKIRPLHFTKLVRLQLKNCDERLNEFLSILLDRSSRLEHLTVEECKSLKHVFDLDRLLLDRQENGRYFMKLKKMTLLNLPELTSIWNKDPTGGFGLGSLEMIEIIGCGSLKNVVFSTWADILRKLLKLSIHECDMMEEVVAMETQGQETHKGVIEFPLLRELELAFLPKFIKFHRGKCALNFPSLEILRVKRCPRMNAFTTGFLEAQALSTTEGVMDADYPRLQRLELLSLDNLEEIWQGLISSESFTVLNELELKECGKLKYVIPSNMLPKFQNLKKVTVMNCASVEEVFHFHQKNHSEVPMVSKLSDLVLTVLPKLTYLSNTEFAIFQNLRNLRVGECNSLKHLLSYFHEDTCLIELEISNCEALEQIVMRKGDESQRKVCFSQLERITLENLPKLSTFSLGTSEFSSLKTLRVKDCSALKTLVSGIYKMKDPPAAPENSENMESIRKLKEPHNKSSSLLIGIPSSMLNKLETITVEGCVLLEQVFDLEDVTDQNDAKNMLPQLSHLILIHLPMLMHVWNKIAPGAFQNLKSLQIIHCNGLKRLFSPSIVNQLQGLETLKLCYCESMEEVLVLNPGDGEEDDKVSAPQISFPKLECLIMKHLPRLESFCGQSCTIRLPKLKTVRVRSIPKMKRFSPGTHCTPVLSAVYVTFIDKCWKEDLNTTIEYLHENKVSV